jgi:Protein of unknown function (DUF2852)
MAIGSNQQAYGGSPWGAGPRNDGYQYDGPPSWYPPFLYSRGGIHPLAIVAIVLGFVFWWPIGLMLLLMMKWSGQMGCWGRRNNQAWANGNGGGNGCGPFQGWAPWKSWSGQQQQTAQPQTATSGNHAFDEYRAATLSRLEEEQKEFGSFLERLRFAKDKAEFDQFMAERRDRPVGPPSAENRPNP